jgi:hypothetical protein
MKKLFFSSQKSINEKMYLCIFKGMEDDFQYLDQYGVTKEQYDAIINELKKY